MPSSLIHRRLFSAIFTIGCLGLAACSRPAKAPATMSMNEWELFVPRESANANCTVNASTDATPSQQPAVVLHSSGAARYGIKPKQDAIKVKAGDRYRLSGWIKLGPKATVEPGSPGALLRATLFTAPNENYGPGHLHVTRDGVLSGDPDRFSGTAISREWTKVEAVIEIPPTVVEMKFFVFCWWTDGDVLVDGATFEKVAVSTPLTQQLKPARS